MNGGIILLDDEVQQSLYTDSTRGNHPNSQRARPQRREPRTDFTSIAAEPRTDFTQRAVPRTDFTSARTDFTTKREPKTDFTVANGHNHPRSSGGDHSGTHSAGKPSNLTHRSSVTATTTEFGTLRGGDGNVFDDRHGDSYPILRDDPSRESSTGSASNNAVDQYAGTSSGLKISVSWIMAGLVAGLVVGVLLSEVKISTVAAQWISLPGDLFIRALKCLVVPYVFCSVAVAVGDIVFVGKVSVIGWQTAKIFVMFWLCTVTMGVTIAMLFRPFFRISDNVGDLQANAMGFTCPNGQLATATNNSSIACSTNSSSLTTASTFVIKDVNNLFTKTTSEVASISLSDQIMTMITTIVSDNIIASLSSIRLLSIITFSMLLGSIAGRSYFTKTRKVNYLYLTLLQLRNTFFMLMEWTIYLSPIAVVSIVAGSFATNEDFIGTLKDVYPFILAALLASSLQVLVIYPTIVFLMTRTNPYVHMRSMVRAYLFAFASASSLATMPVTLSCVKKARMCSQSVANFVVSIGVVSGLSGMGWYLPISLTFLAEASGNGDELTVLRVVGMFVLSLLACAGTPPIPASSLVMISTAYATLFGTVPKTTFAYIIATDFIIDRISTTCNVNDDVMALKIISETTDETVAQDHLGERF